MDATGDARGSGNKAVLRCSECGQTWLNLAGLAVMLGGFQSETRKLQDRVNALEARLGLHKAAPKTPAEI